jgi:hypothetical protein
MWIKEPVFGHPVIWIELKINSLLYLLIFGAPQTCLTLGLSSQLSPPKKQPKPKNNGLLLGRD